MNERERAEEHLKVIRQLMERATIYRAVSAQAALVGALLSIIVAGVLWYQADRNPLDPQTGRSLSFLGPWLAVLAVTAGANAWFLWREAGRRGEVFASSGMRLALRSLAPGLLCGAAATWYLGGEGFLRLPGLWMLFYGLALLATSHFAPRSITYLGWSFLLAGLLSVPYLDSCFSSLMRTLAQASNLAMGLTFGLFHLIYALCTWPRKREHEGQ